MKKSFTVDRVFVNQGDKKGYQPTPEECQEIQRELARKGINVQTSIKHYHKGDMVITGKQVINL